MIHVGAGPLRRLAKAGATGGRQDRGGVNPGVALRDRGKGKENVIKA
jgi:hypothetical protein